MEDANGSEEIDYVYHATDAFGNAANGTITEHISGNFPPAFLQVDPDGQHTHSGNIGDQVGGGGPYRNLDGDYTEKQTFTETINSGGFIFTGGSLTSVFVHSFSVVNGRVTNIQFSVQAP